MRGLLLGMVLLLLSACGGGGGGGSIVLGPTPNPAPTPNPYLPPSPEPNIGTPTFSIAGTIDIAPGVSVDDDINDALAQHCSYNRLPSEPKCQNDTRAQRINHLATVMGFASAQGTGGDATQERFNESADEVDFYYVEALANQKVVLNVVDYEQADLDLYLYRYVNDALDEDAIAYSISNDPQEQLVIPQDGKYLIAVVAEVGISKYVLQLLPAVEGLQASSFNRFVSGEMVVKYKPQQQPSTARAVALEPQPELIKLPQARMAFNATSNTPQSLLPAELLEKRRTLQAIKRLRMSGEVEYAEPNFIRTSQAIPNDPNYGYQWHYNAINLPQAWDIGQGYSANGVIVAVLDTGVFTAHPDLSSKLVDGYDFVDGDNNADDPGDGTLPGTHSWHGTHVAGTIAAASNNGTGIAGVSWGAKVMPVRVLGKGGGTSYNVAQGIRYAARLSNSSGTLPTNKADIINLSLGSTSSSQVEQDAIAAAINANVLVVAAAGNNGKNELFYPAAYADVIGVGATRLNGTKASYSNMGSHVDVAAPGGQTAEDVNGDRNPDGVLSTYVNDASGTRQPSYAWLQGTSMAAPHVAGVLALMKAVNPDLTQSDVLAMITACEITSRRGACSRDNNVGYGQIDAYLALQKANELNAGTLPAILVPATSSITIQPLSQSYPSTVQVSVNNYGKDSASTITVSKTQAWLSVTSTPPTTVAPNQAFNLSLSASSAGLSNGSYQDVLTIRYYNGSAQKSLIIPIIMVVGQLGNGSTLTQHYVLLEDADCVANKTKDNCIVKQVAPTSRVSNGFAYANFVFTGVEPGNYRIYAGTDIDVDMYICQDGETCGVYPAAGQPLKMEGNFSGADITVQLNGTAALQAAGFERSANSLQLKRNETINKSAAR